MLRISKERWVFILAQAGVLDGATLRSLATSPGLALITFGRSTRLHSTSYVTHRVSLHVNNLHRNRESARGVHAYACQCGACSQPGARHQQGARAQLWLCYCVYSFISHPCSVTPLRRSVFPSCPPPRTEKMLVSSLSTTCKPYGMHSANGASATVSWQGC